MHSLKNNFVKLLRWSERYTKTDMVYLTKNSSWLTVGQFVSAMASFSLSILFANLLSKEVYGSYRFILASTSFLTIFTLPGLNVALIRSVAKHASGTIYPALKTRLSWSVLTGLSSLGIAGYYWFFAHNVDMAASFLIAALFLPLMESFLLYESVLQGKKQFNVMTQQNIIATLVAVITMIITLLVTDTLYVIVSAYFIPWTVMRYIFLKKIFRTIPITETIDPNAITYGKHLSLMSIVGIAATQLDKILLFTVLGPLQVATYSIAIAPLEQIKGFLKNIYTIALPKLSAQNNDTIVKNIGIKTWRFLCFIALVMGGYILLAPLFFSTFFPTYSESIPLSQLYAISIIGTASVLPLGALQSQENTRGLYLYNASANILQVVLLVVGVYSAGVMGVIIARIIGRFCTLGITTIILRRS